MRLLIAFFCLLIVGFSLMRRPVPTNAAPLDYDIIIRHGRVVDGTGRPGFNADVAIKNDRIARIGNLSSAKATREIDARGQVVAFETSKSPCPEGFIWFRKRQTIANIT